jgi:hypothetical protein
VSTQHLLAFMAYDKTLAVDLREDHLYVKSHLFFYALKILFDFVQFDYDMSCYGLNHGLLSKIYIETQSPMQQCEGIWPLVMIKSFTICSSNGISILIKGMAFEGSTFLALSPSIV